MRVVLEGLPGAGKTSHSQQLAQDFGCPLIPEWAGFSEDNWKRHNLRLPYYLANDETKEFLGNLFSERLVLFDRHYTGALAYGYALTTVRGANRSTGECYEENFAWYRRCIQNKTLTPPDYVFVIEISPTASIQRQPRASAGDPIWGDIACLEAMRFYYHQFYALIEPQVQVVWIDGEIAQARVCTAIRDHLASFL
jgi:thymidylate kinase